MRKNSMTIGFFAGLLVLASMYLIGVCITRYNDFELYLCFITMATSGLIYHYRMKYLDDLLEMKDKEIDFLIDYKESNEKGND